MYALALLTLAFTADNCATDWALVKGRLAWTRETPQGWVVYDANAPTILLAKDAVWYVVPPRDPAMWHWESFDEALQFASDNATWPDKSAKPLIPPVLIRPAASSCSGGSCGE